LFFNTNATQKKILFGIGSIIFLFFFSYENFIIIQKNFDSISTGISGLIILIYCVYYLFQKISQPNGLIDFDHNFFIIVSFIIYFAGTFFIYILSKNNFLDQKFQNSYILINSLILVTRNLLISFAFLLKIKESTLAIQEN
jgi:hypothetical protein